MMPPQKFNLVNKEDVSASKMEEKNSFLMLQFLDTF